MKKTVSSEKVSPQKRVLAEAPKSKVIAKTSAKTKTKSQTKSPTKSLAKNLTKNLSSAKNLKKAVRTSAKTPSVAAQKTPKTLTKRAVAAKANTPVKIPSSKSKIRTAKSAVASTLRKKSTVKKAINTNGTSNGLNRKRSAAARKGWETRRKKLIGSESSSTAA